MQCRSAFSLIEFLPLSPLGGDRRAPYFETHARPKTRVREGRCCRWRYPLHGAQNM